MKTELFENDVVPVRVFLKHNMDGKHLMRFQSETSVIKFSKFSRHGVDEASETSFTIGLYGTHAIKPLSCSVRSTCFIAKDSV